MAGRLGVWKASRKSAPASRTSSVSRSLPAASRRGAKRTTAKAMPAASAALNSDALDRIESGRKGIVRASSAATVAVRHSGWPGKVAPANRLIT